MHVQRPDGEALSEYHRVIWCPFIPDDCDDSSNTESSTQDASRVLVLTHNEKVRKFSDFIMHERKRYMVHVIYSLLQSKCQIIA